MKLSYLESKSQNTPAEIRRAVERFRNRVVCRCLGRCEVCLYFDPTWGELLRVHHIVHVSKGGRSSISNLIALCSNCHTATHLFHHRKFQHQKKYFRLATFEERVNIVMRYGYQRPAAERMTLIATENVLMDRKGGIMHVLRGDGMQTYTWEITNECELGPGS